MTTPVYLLTELTDNQASPHATVNEMLRVVEGHARVISRTTTAEPAVVNGDAYIMPVSPTGTLWGTFAQHDLVIGVGGTWKKYTPIEGWNSVWVNDEDVLVSFNGTLWNPNTDSLNATGAAAPTIASATTIAPTNPITFVSGTTNVVTITPPSPIDVGGGQITIIPTGLFATTAAGNIAIASTAVVSKALIMTYDVTTDKWYPSY